MKGAIQIYITIPIAKNRIVKDNIVITLSFDFNFAFSSLVSLYTGLKESVLELLIL